MLSLRHTEKGAFAIQNKNVDQTSQKVVLVLNWSIFSILHLLDSLNFNGRYHFI